MPPDNLLNQDLHESARQRVSLLSASLQGFFDEKGEEDTGDGSEDSDKIPPKIASSLGRS